MFNFDIDSLNGYSINECIFTNDIYKIYCNTTIFINQPNIVTFELFKHDNLLLASTELSKIKNYLNNL